jgi:hypothetical protein
MKLPVLPWVSEWLTPSSLFPLLPITTRQWPVPCISKLVTLTVIRGGPHCKDTEDRPSSQMGRHICHLLRHQSKDKIYDIFHVIDTKWYIFYPSWYIHGTSSHHILMELLFAVSWTYLLTLAINREAIILLVLYKHCKNIKLIPWSSSQKLKLNVHTQLKMLSLTNIKFLLAPMGVLAPRLRTLDGPLVPPSTRAEFFWRTCLGGGIF